MIVLTERLEDASLARVGLEDASLTLFGFVFDFLSGLRVKMSDS